MEYAVVFTPAAPVRRRPAHYREMTSQLLFGETVQVLKTRGDLWVKVRSRHDQYEGWMTRSMLLPISEKQAGQPVRYVTSGMLNEIKRNGETELIPVGASLPRFLEKKGKLGPLEYEYEGFYLNRFEKKASAAQLILLAKQWLNAPYLWGGRTPLGVDCSGFMQVIFKMTGIDLPRDTWQQAQDGKSVKKFKDIEPGDLVFFDKKETIVHVGMYIGDGQLIHASGRVRIDEIDEKSIRWSDTQKRALPVKAIRRILPV